MTEEELKNLLNQASNMLTSKIAVSLQNVLDIFIAERDRIFNQVYAATKDKLVTTASIPSQAPTPLHTVPSTDAK